MKHDFYADENETGWIPDVKMTKVEGDRTERRVWFLWQGKPQWLEMSTQYDGFWLVSDTKYTEDFEEWLDENLDDYDSLESMFSTGLLDVIPDTYSVEFEVGEDDNEIEVCDTCGVEFSAFGINCNCHLDTTDGLV